MEGVLRELRLRQEVLLDPRVELQERGKPGPSVPVASAGHADFATCAVALGESNLTSEIKSVRAGSKVPPARRGKSQSAWPFDRRFWT